jgi:hypothetical protein
MVDPCQACRYPEDLRRLSTELDSFRQDLKAATDTTWNLAAEALRQMDILAGLDAAPEELADLDQERAEVLDIAPKISRRAEITEALGQTLAQAAAIDCAGTGCKLRNRCPKLAFIREKTRRITSE